MKDAVRAPEIACPNGRAGRQMTIHETRPIR